MQYSHAYYSNTFFECFQSFRMSAIHLSPDRCECHFFLSLSFCARACVFLWSNRNWPTKIIPYYTYIICALYLFFVLLSRRFADNMFIIDWHVRDECEREWARAWMNVYYVNPPSARSRWHINKKPTHVRIYAVQKCMCVFVLPVCWVPTSTAATIIPLDCTQHDMCMYGA